MANHNPPTNGLDKRPFHINRKGRPKSFKQLRELAQSLGNEIATKNGKEIIICDKVVYENGEPVIVNGHIATVAEMMMRSWTHNDKRQKDFIEFAYGKVPQPVELSNDKENPVIFDITISKKDDTA